MDRRTESLFIVLERTLNFVAGYCQAGRQVCPFDASRDLLALEDGCDIQQLQSRSLVEQTFDMVGVGDLSSHHLIAAADSNNGAASRVMVRDKLVPSASAQPPKIGNRAFRSWEADHVEAACLRRVFNVLNRNIRLAQEGLEVGVVRDSREDHHSYRDRAIGRWFCAGLQPGAIFFRYREIAGVRQHSKDRHPSALLDNLQSVV